MIQSPPVSEKANETYNADQIQVLEGLEAVRKRPGMYIGTTGPDGLHHLITEIFDNSRDEAMGGFANDIEIVLLPKNLVRVTDNGRGIPVDTHKQTKVSDDIDRVSRPALKLLIYSDHLFCFNMCLFQYLFYVHASCF